MELMADLHIHTCLSPCAEPEMVPTLIVASARDRGLDVIGICDHNSAENVAAVQTCARGTGLLVLGGMEITSVEEVHMLGLFGDHESLMEAQQRVYAHLDGQNDEQRFGCQWIVDAEDYVVGKSAKMLIGASTLSIEDIVGMIHRLGGIAVAAHVDREAFSLVGQLGMVPAGLELDALEVSEACPHGFRAEGAGSALPLVRSSDAHVLINIGKGRTSFTVEAATFDEIRMALQGRQGRSVHR
jgi:hypothetical protein